MDLNRAATNGLQMSVPEFFIQGGAGTTTVQCCSFFIFAAVSRQAASTALLRRQQLRRGVEVAPGLRALRGHQRRTAFQRSAPMIVAAIRPSSPNGNSRAKIGAANKQNSTATPPVHSNVGLNLPEAKSVIAAASQQRFA